MAAGRFQAFFGDDWEDALDSIKSVPGAFGNIFLAGIRQLRLFDVVVFVLVLAGWLWLVVGYGVLGDHRTLLLGLALLPTALWFGAGLISGVVFEVSGIGVRVLGYWEAYVLILLFGFFGTISLRLALNPRDRRVYRGTPSTTPPEA